MEFKEKQRLRLAFLNTLYEMSEDEHSRPIFGGEVAEKIGMNDMDAAYAIIKYLAGENLVEEGNIDSPPPYYVKITHNGIKEVESANLHPDQPTEHFLPKNALFVNNLTMIGSSIQQGTDRSSQTTITQTNSLKDIEEFFVSLSNKIDQLSLDSGSYQELKSDIETIQSQLKSPKPKTSIIKEVLESTRTILESATGGVIASELVIQIPPLLALLTS